MLRRLSSHMRYGPPISVAISRRGVDKGNRIVLPIQSATSIISAPSAGSAGKLLHRPLETDHTRHMGAE